MTLSQSELAERKRLTAKLPKVMASWANKQPTTRLRALVAKMERTAASKRESAEERRVKRALGVGSNTNTRACREIAGAFYLDVPADFVPNQGAE